MAIVKCLNNDNSFNYSLICGSSFYDDTILISLASLKSIFPEEFKTMCPSSDGKVKYELIFGIYEDGKLIDCATLYDWKEDWNYIEENEPILFHIGAKNATISHQAKMLIEDYISKH